MTDELEEFGPESFLGLPEDSCTIQPPAHVVAERQLGIDET